MANSEKIHLIAIGGAVMHNLAIALQNNGATVTGSDDNVFDPSRSRLKDAGLLPSEMGWFPERITSDLDYVIIGMHAKADNPELIKAKELNLKVYSFPEFIFQKSRNKQRVVVAGSHGKTTITSMIMHALKEYNKVPFDYLVGAQLDGFETMVQISDAPIIILEGDEYLTSPLDPEPKFLKYHHHIAIISGIAWDHINVYPDYEGYVEQFRKLVQQTPIGGLIIYNEDDKTLKKIVEENHGETVKLLPYSIHKHKVVDGQTILINGKDKYPIEVFGDHNLYNINAAWQVCERLRIPQDDFLKYMTTFKGAARRMELVGKSTGTAIFKDFAHSPSKLKATCSALKNQFNKRNLVACLELHTFSSLNKEFIGEYKDTFNADQAIVYYNPQTVEQKKLDPIDESEIKKAFNNDKLQVFTDSKLLQDHLKNQKWDNTNLLMMSSGDFGGLNLDELSQTILS